MNTTILCFIIIVIVASMLQAAIGFGFPILAMGFFPLLFSYTKSVALCQAVAVATTTVMAIRYRKHVPWRTFLPLLVPTIAISSVFTFVSISLNSNVMFMILGSVLVLLAIYFMVFSQKLRITPNFRNAVCIGSFCGILNGLTSICGPPAALYLLTAYEDKKEYIGCIQTLFCISNIVSILIRISLGSLEFTDFNYIIIGWAAMALGTILGLNVFKRLDNKVFKKIVYLFIGLNGIWIIVSHLL